MKKNLVQCIGEVPPPTLWLQGPQNEGNRPLRGCYKLGKASLITLGGAGARMEGRRSTRCNTP